LFDNAHIKRSTGEDRRGDQREKSKSHISNLL
jgi:hypothetical protein